MINRLQLLRDLQKMLPRLEDELRRRCGEDPSLEAAAGLRQEFDILRASQRTAEAYETWREAQFTQVAVAWILSAVFVRFLEDNGLLDRADGTPVAWISGAGTRLALARDARTQYFRQQPRHADPHYLQHVFETVGKLPALAGLFDRRHNALWRMPLSDDAARELIEFFQRGDEKTGALAHDFSDPDGSTRFLGDLYQDLSDDAKKRFALLQTPEFVEEFILDQTLTPAIERFGFREVRLIDPTCGSGHFNLGAFHRLFALHERNRPGASRTELAQDVLRQIYGVDVNPFAVAIARFRLMLAAVRASERTTLQGAPAFETNLVAGDSLIHARPELAVTAYYETEEAPLLQKILRQQYHAVVGNPPYITVKDKKLNELYRYHYGSCHRKYSLAAPFMELFFALAENGDGTGRTPAGFVGMITANSFMKREFGKKLVEEYIPKWDLTHVIDTAGAYIPGHGTPTVILFGKNQPPVADTIRTVMGIKGEPATPADPAQGLVWQAILNQLNQPGSESDFVSVANTPRKNFHKHPWSIGGGGAAELKDRLDDSRGQDLVALIDVVGVFGMTNADEVLLASAEALTRRHVESMAHQSALTGDQIRDYVAYEGEHAIFPYSTTSLLSLEAIPKAHQWMWPCRTTMGNRATFNKGTYFKDGLAWYKWHQVALERLGASQMICYASVATHNHFVLERGKHVFKQSAPIIKLKSDAGASHHLVLLGALNSSAACFWMKQVFHCKGSTVDQHGARQRTMPFEDFFDHDGTKLKSFPVPNEVASVFNNAAQTPLLTLATELDRLAQEMQRHEPTAVLAGSPTDVAAALTAARAEQESIRARMIASQEELDWQAYRAYGLVEADSGLFPADPLCASPLALGQRAFEIAMARKMAAGKLETKWFERHRSTPITDLPSDWPPAYRAVVEKRLEKIAADRDIALIEQPEYKRRWSLEPWEDRAQAALKAWLLDRMETWFKSAVAPELTSAAYLRDNARNDPAFMQTMRVYVGSDFDPGKIMAALVEDEAVPNLPVQRYKESGLRKRLIWEQVWDLQRREDAVEAEVRGQKTEDGRQRTEDELKAAVREAQRDQVGEIPVPPRYDSKDFRDTAYWRLRGKLDVPKERFIAYPDCERDGDPTLCIGWAGWDYPQQATALGNYYERMRSQEGWPRERLLLLLVNLSELIPWLMQWHGEYDPNIGASMGEYFRDFVAQECRRLKVDPAELDRMRCEGVRAETADNGAVVGEEEA